MEHFSTIIEGSFGALTCDLYGSLEHCSATRALHLKTFFGEGTVKATPGERTVKVSPCEGTVKSSPGEGTVKASPGEGTVIASPGDRRDDVGDA